MSGAPEDWKDRLAARALSRLGDPPLPEGFAARIAARATATPQVQPAPRESWPVTASDEAIVAGVVHGEAAAPRRWPAYAAASIAALAVAAIGALALDAGPQGRQRPSIAKDEPAARLPQTLPQAAAEMAEAAPQRRASVPKRKTSKSSAAPLMRPPVPVAAQPGAPAASGTPAEPPPPAAKAGEEEMLAQSGPQLGPGDGGGSRAVYGPPAPKGLGIAGSINGSAAAPGESTAAGRGPRNAPPGGMPGSPSGPSGGSGPLGPGPRI